MERKYCKETMTKIGETGDVPQILEVLSLRAQKWKLN